MIKTVGEFVDLIAQMRIAQRHCFRNPSPSVLNYSKKLEKQVDEAIEQYMKRKEEKAQPGLGLQ